VNYFVAIDRLAGHRVASISDRAFVIARGGSLMSIFKKFRMGFAALAAVAALGLTAPAAQADSGRITFKVVKAGFVIGASGGSGTLSFHGRRYPISIGGLSYGFTFGASATNFRGRVTNIRRPSDVAGVYAAAGAGAAAVKGAGAIVLTNNKGAVLTIAGEQTGLIVAADLNGLIITLQ
jgi:hypothetical protein